MILKIKNIINNLMLLSFTFASAFTFILLNGCGEGKVDINEAKFAPKIVIRGYLYAGKTVDDIRITRNVPLNAAVSEEDIVLEDAVVKLIELSSGNEYNLVFDAKNLTYHCINPDFKIAYEKSYRLEVWAGIDGKNLYAYSETTVPSNGFKINASNADSISYREKDSEGNLKKYKINFHPSPNADIYAVSIVAMKHDLSNFIYDNPYRNPDPSYIMDNMDQFEEAYSWLQNYKPGAEELNFEIEWMSVWFYSRYRVIIYAGDKNFKDFFLTQKDVQELDGNFHEPVLHIGGDGIGVFASADVDTTYFTVTR